MTHRHRPLIVLSLIAAVALLGASGGLAQPLAPMADDPPPTLAPDIYARLNGEPGPYAPTSAQPPESVTMLSCTNLLDDSSFELYTPNPYWFESSTNFSTPLCTTADCGTGTGTAGPRTGNVWSWFGGTAAEESASLVQWVTIPEGPAWLELYIWLGTSTGDAGDTFTVTVGGAPSTDVLVINATESAAWGGDYHGVMIDLASFADGSLRQLVLGSYSIGQSVNFNVDDVFLWSCPEKVYLPLVMRNYDGSSTLAAPTLLTPAEGSTLAKTTFDWSDVVGATGYRFQLSTSPSFSPLIVDSAIAMSQYDLTSTLSGTHYWRVYATGPSGSGPYSASRSVILVDYNADDDGDALRNGWELHGYDYGANGTIDVDLPAMGASYRHKDLFVEMDYMYRADATYGLAPNGTVLAAIEAAFDAFPMANPDGIPGVNIHLELDDLVPYDADLDPYFTQFNALKAAWFPSNRLATHHYMIWANQYGGGTSSGVSMGIPASDFLVTLGGWNGGLGGTDSQKIGTFIHELGHNLNLTHGGSDHVNYKPNYISIMNYFFQTWGVYHNATWYNWEYQPFALPALNEAALNEPGGLGSAAAAGYGTLHYCPPTLFYDWDAGGAIDWNCDSDTIDGAVSRDVNWDGLTNTLAATSNNYNQILFDGGTIGSGLAPDALREFARRLAETVVPRTDELTWEMQQEIDQMHRQMPVASPSPLSDNR